MIAPYKGKFKVSQTFKGEQHDGLDLVGIDSKDILSTVDGMVIYAGWENTSNKKQGFGQYVKIRDVDSTNVYYFGHLSEISVKYGDSVKVGQKIGVEGSTGKSTGSHLHYCVRKNGVKGMHIDINELSGIPNKLGYYGEEEKSTPTPVKKEDTSGFNPTMDVVSPFADNTKAKSFENALSGMYKSVTRVNLRKAPDTTKNNVRIVVDKGDKVRCYGYFTEVKGVKWYYVVYKGYEGYVCSTYFVKA